jgi:cysteinyl-tRNA synthetase
MSLRLYNTMTRRVEEFRPLSPPTVSLYTCGPTVYNFAHIGNLRTYVFEDVLVRTLRMEGFDVKRVMNVTDVGHLVSDADEGEDKMEKGAAREGKTIREIARFYYDAFERDMRRLNLLPPEVWCWATDEIDTQKAQVETLAAKGYTYVIEDGIYFDTAKLSDYGKLAGQDLRDLKAGARVELAADKKNPTDFAVWKFSPKGKQRLMEWDNPCGRPGKGFPGWHIECSAMAIKHLGEYLDIHCGGVDHVKVHHTNEIAQAESALGHEWCRWWMHGEFLTMGEAGKMAKSAGEFLTLDRLIEKGYEPPAYRYFLLNAHYRQQLIFSWDGLDAAANAYKNLKRAALDLRKGYRGDEKPLEKHLAAFRQAVEDDLNMPRALAALWAAAKDSAAPPGEVYATLLEMDRVLGLGVADMQEEILAIDPAEIDKLLAERAAARKSKNFARADEIRNQLDAAGVEIMDSAGGTGWRKKS